MDVAHMRAWRRRRREREFKDNSKARNYKEKERVEGSWLEKRGRVGCEHVKLGATRTVVEIAVFASQHNEDEGNTDSILPIAPFIKDTARRIATHDLQLPIRLHSPIMASSRLTKTTTASIQYTCKYASRVRYHGLCAPSPFHNYSSTPKRFHSAPPESGPRTDLYRQRSRSHSR